MESGVAINRVCLELSLQKVTFTLESAMEVEPGIFEVAVHQVQPEGKVRTFQVREEKGFMKVSEVK